MTRIAEDVSKFVVDNPALMAWCEDSGNTLGFFHLGDLMIFLFSCLATSLCSYSCFFVLVLVRVGVFRLCFLCVPVFLCLCLVV